MYNESGIPDIRLWTMDNGQWIMDNGKLFLDGQNGPNKISNGLKRVETTQNESCANESCLFKQLLTQTLKW